MISVAMVMPEIGFDEEPIRPVMRDDTVAKKKPKSTIRIDTRMLPCVGSPGVTARKMARASEPTEHDRHRHVAFGAQLHAAARRAEALQALRGPTTTIVGSVRRQRDQTRREHRAGADVADVGAPDLARAHLRDQERQAGVAGLLAKFG